jgi:hypothetical protein
MRALAFFLVMGIIWAQEEHKVAEEVIKAKAELKIEDAFKPKGHFPLDPAEPVDSLLKETGLLRTTLDLAPIERMLFTSLYTSSSYLREPTSYEIREVVRIPVPKTKMKIETWRLIILDSKGDEVWEMNGRGNPPEEIVWNGKKKGGGVLVPGEPYTPVLYAFKEGIRRRIVGDPLKMESFAFDFGDSALIRVEINALFDSLSAELKEGAQEKLKSILNWVKSFGAIRLNVYIYSGNFNLREEIGKVIDEYIRRHFVVNELSFTIKPLPFKEGERKYERIDILITKGI